MMDGKMKNEDEKRKYMESITNPDRFANFSTYQQLRVEEEDCDKAVDDYGEEAPEMERTAVGKEEEVLKSNVGTVDDFAKMKRQIAEDQELLDLNKVKQEQSAACNAVESILSMMSSNDAKKQPPLPIEQPTPPPEKQLTSVPVSNK